MSGRKATFSHHQFQDLTGQKFGMLTFVRPLGKNRWVVRCDCGNEKEVQADNVKRGRTTACGCLHRRHIAEKTGRGPSREFRREYFTLKNMLRRCREDEHYTAKGIRVCDRWAESLEAFVADMGRHPGRSYTIERKDNAKGYEPGNCIWAKMDVQSRNRENNHPITFNGTTMVVTDWATKLGLPSQTLFERLRRGWSIERALTTPRMGARRSVRTKHATGHPTPHLAGR